MNDLKKSLILGKLSITILTISAAYLVYQLIDIVKTGNSAAIIAMTIIIMIEVGLWIWNVFG